MLANDGDYFDQLVGNDGDFNPFTDRGWRTLARCFARASGGRTQSATILDIGCGTGQSARIYDAHAARYVGIDLSSAALRVAAARSTAHRWVQADAFCLPFRDHTFDVVGLSSVLHHLPDMATALAEAQRVLKRGGLVFAFDPNLLHPAMLLFRHRRSPLYRAAGVSPQEQPLPPRALRDTFTRVGFQAIGQRCQSDIPYRAVAPPLMNALLPLYNALDIVWEWSGAGRAFGTFVVTWGRKP